ncbi:hypothetical protein B0H14DRAFT_2945337 [Mycena olivaceomarginata]|nr:hypothetical protein B0H14DRAFT_2945337 [Mycena olivaceomarginata]
MWCFWAFVMERFCGSLVPAVKSRKHPFASLAHRIRDVAQLSQIKLLYGLTVDLSPQKNMDDTGLVFDDYPDICMVYPHRTMDIDGPLRNKILLLWGKLKWLGGGLIHAWDMVSTYHNSPDSTCDATFIKFTLEVDKNERYPNLPVVLQHKAVFGQVRKFIALTLNPKFPARHDAGEQERVDSARERTILLAAVADAKLIRQLPTGNGCFDGKSSDLGAPSQVIDIESIDFAVKFKLIEDASGDSNEG